MSIKISWSSDGLEVFTPPTLKQMCLYKCLTNKEILAKEVEVDEATGGSEKLPWEKYRLKEAIQRELVEALLDAGDEYLFMLTPKYEPVLAAIRMSQSEHLVKVHVNNTHTLKDHQLEFLLSGGHVKSLDINGCESLGSESLVSINKFGSKLEYLRIGDSYPILPQPAEFCRQRQNSAILRTPNLKTFIVSEIHCHVTMEETNYWRFLLQDFISNLEDLQISRSHTFQSLEFLEPAKSKLSSLTLWNCMVLNNAKAWASLFKLDKLRFLDLVGSSFEEAFVGENIVQRLLAVMPNLTRLAVDPGLIKDICLDTPIRGQGQVAKRLEFLGILENEVTELRKAKLLANDVAYFGTVEGELRMLEYLRNRRPNGCHFDPTLERLLQSLSLVAQTPPCKSVAFISLLMKIFKNDGVTVLSRGLFFTILKKLLTADLSVKSGEVLLDQCIGVIFAMMSKWYEEKLFFNTDADARMINNTIDIMMILDSELRLDHYVTLVPMIMHMAEKVMMDSLLHEIGMATMASFMVLLTKIAQILERAVDRFPGEIHALWGISSFVFVIKKLKNVMVSVEGDRNDLVEILSSMIASVGKMCLNSGPRRAAFYSANGVGIVMDLLKEIIDGCLDLAERDSLTLLYTLKSILQDAKLKLSESGLIASGLEELLLSVHKQWEVCKSSNSQNSERDTTHYFQLESISGLLNFLECDPRYDYKTSAAVKEIMMKLK